MQVIFGSLQRGCARARRSGFAPALLLCLALGVTAPDRAVAAGDETAGAATPADPEGGAAVPGDYAWRERPPAPPRGVRAEDQPNDAGGVIVVAWELSADDQPDSARVTGYEVLRATAHGGPYETVGRTAARATRYVDSAASIGVPFFYRVRALGRQEASDSTPVGPAVSSYQWFNWERGNVLALALLLSGALLYHVRAIARGRPASVRRIPALEAIEEAVGRATEMGRPVLFIPGVEDMSDIQTVAAMTVLGRVAATVAEYEAELEVPNSRSLVMTTAQDTVEKAYLAAGRGDAYRPQGIYYVTNEQFGYAAAVSGIIVRQRPAACLYFGAFFAESLSLAETGQTVGAVQIAGTAETTQIPFFLAACDYVLIGEEFYAASAYLSGEPKQLGSLKGQDFGKVIAAAAVGAGCLLATLSELSGSRALAAAAGFVERLFVTR